MKIIRRKKNGTEICSIENCSTPLFNLRYQASYGGYLCNKHRIQWERYGKIYNRTIYDKNRIFINKDLNCAEMELYDRYGNIVATTIFDIEDIPLVEKYKWYLSTRRKENYTDYVGCGGSTSPERYLLHRLIMGDYDTYEDTDHKNGNGLDNRKCNLRQCNASQNLLNRTKQIDSLLGFKNIIYRKAGNKYVIQIVMTDEKNKIRKQCSSLQEAINYRDAIYRRFLLNVNLFRDEIDTTETFSYDYDRENNRIFIHEKGKEVIIYGFLFDLIIHDNPEVYINSNYSPSSMEKFKKLLCTAELPYIEWCILNDYIENDPLSEENLDGVLDLVIEVNKRYSRPQHIEDGNKENNNILNDNANEIRLSCPQKSIWLYTGYEWEHIFDPRWHYHPQTQEKLSIGRWKRQQIISQCDVLIDGKYIDSQRDITLPWCGSANQRVIDIKESLQKGEIVLWEM